MKKILKVLSLALVLSTALSLCGCKEKKSSTDAAETGVSKKLAAL